VAERRYPNGLYRRARLGQIPQFTGIDSSYEPAQVPELRLDTTMLTAERSAGLVTERVTSADRLC
jgi:adenylylsulfate kinase-like enzyme